MILTDEIARRDSPPRDASRHRGAPRPGHGARALGQAAKITFDKRLFAELTSVRFVEAHRHVVVLGPVGVGKTFLANALGHIACRPASQRALHARRRDAAHAADRAASTTRATPR